MNITDKNNIVSIPQNDASYPKEWNALLDSPPILYAVGNVTLINTRKFTVVGSRTTPVTALKLGMTLAKELSQSFTLVTGTADGGDSAVIEGGILGGGRLICLLAGGFSAIPQNNLPLLERVVKQGGLLLSPHPYDTSVRAFSYEYRNKLLAGLGEGVLVLGAGLKSGALITARHAQKQGKPVFAFPYAPNTHSGAGCNALIKAGAYLTESAEDISERLGVKIEKKATGVTLSEDEKKMLSALYEQGESHINLLSQTTGIPIFKARMLLSALEVKGVAVALGGNRYAPV